MGLFSKPKEEIKQPAFKIENEREAWIALLYLTSTTDGELSSVEINSFSRIVILKSFFDGYDFISILRRMMEAKKSIGENSLMDMAAPFIKEENKATLLAVSIDLVMADGTLGKEEEAIIEKIAKKLNMDEALAQRIVEVMMYKNKYNKEIIDDDDDD